jgi:hypothetical protein
MVRAMSPPTREVIRADAFVWLARAGVVPGASFITSLPDLAEVPALGFEGWRAFFARATQAVLAATPEDGVAIFFQSDVRRDGLHVDKGYAVMRAAEGSGHALLFHKVVCRKPPGTITFGRVGYSHLLAFSKGVRLNPALNTPDVLPELGEMPWVRAMGVAACEASVRFVQRHTASRVIVDPFCGHGTVANAAGLDALGIEQSSKRCRKARELVWPPVVS